MDCRRIRDSLIESINGELTVSKFPGYCIITLPLMTPDGRYIDVYVDEPSDDDPFVVVHDGGKTASELYAQGIHLTTPKRAVLSALAKRFGVLFSARNDTFPERSDAFLTLAGGPDGLTARGESRGSGLVPARSHPVH